MIQFTLTDWKLKLTISDAQQYDHKSVDVLITGDIPEGWIWKLYIGKDCFLNLIPLTQTDEGLFCTLLRTDLAYSGTYTAQLYASHGDTDLPDKRSSKERFTVNFSLNGDIVWPEVPKAFTDAVNQADSAAAAAIEAAGHYPYIDPNTKTWFIWDVITGQFVDTGISAGGMLSYEVVDELPVASEETLDKIYFVPTPDPKHGNVMDEYVTMEDDDGNYYWEQIGSTEVDISGKEDKSNKTTSIDSNSTDAQYPSAKAVYDYVEDSEHFIVSDTNPYVDSEDYNKLWIDPTDNTENPGGGGSSDLPLRITKSIEPGPGGATVYDIEFT